MARFSADTLDIALLPPPQAVKPLDYEVILAARVADLSQRLRAAGIDYDIGQLETDPLKILEETDAYRELLDLAAINDAVRAVMLPLAAGTDLDNLAAFYGVTRLVVTPAQGATPAVMESDARFRARALLAPEAFSCAGALGGYVFHALTADPLVKDVGVRVLEGVTATAHGPALDRTVEVALLSSQGDGTPSTDTIARVRARLFRKDIRPLTDVISVVAADVLPYSVTGTIYVPGGPDPAAVKAQAEAAVTAAAGTAHRVGLVLYPDTFLAALRAGPVRHAVLASPSAPLGGGRQAPFMSGLAVTVEVIDE